MKPEGVGSSHAFAATISHAKTGSCALVPAEGLEPTTIEELKALKEYARGSRFVLPGKHPNRPANPKLITRGVQRLLPRFLAHEIEAFTPHDLRRTGRTTLGRLGVTPLIAERVINHSKDVLQETYDLWDYFDEKHDALERLEKYLRGLVRANYIVNSARAQGAARTKSAM